MKVRIQRLTATAKLPTYATDGSAGMTLHADVEHSVRLPPGKTGIISTGLRIEVPEGHGLLILPRSGLVVRHGVTVLNTPGLTDADHRDEIKVVLHNFSLTVFHVVPDAPIAQCIILPIPTVQWVQTDSLTETASEESGFGSAGS